MALELTRKGRQTLFTPKTPPQEGGTMPPQPSARQAGQPRKIAVKEITLNKDHRAVIRVQRRKFQRLRQAKLARQHLRQLPEPGEAVHLVVRGDYSFWSLVPAVLEICKPARIQELLIATLSFSDDNARDLVALLDAGQIGRVGMVVSCYFRDLSPHLFDPLAAELHKRGHHIAGVRNHSKVTLMALSDGRRITMEGSANLRSCRNIEQFCISIDPELHAFHARWIQEVLTRGDEK